MRIGQLTAATGVSRDTVRYYERQGLLAGVTRTEATNNYKDYPDDNVRRIKIVRHLKRFGFTLRECRELLEERDRLGGGCIDRGKVFAGKLTQIDAQIGELQRLRESLVAAMGNLG